MLLAWLSASLQSSQHTKRVLAAKGGDESRAGRAGDTNSAQERLAGGAGVGMRSRAQELGARGGAGAPGGGFRDSRCGEGNGAGGRVAAGAGAAGCRGVVFRADRVKVLPRARRGPAREGAAGVWVCRAEARRRRRRARGCAAGARLGRAGARGRYNGCSAPLQWVLGFAGTLLGTVTMASRLRRDGARERYNDLSASPGERPAVRGPCPARPGSCPGPPGRGREWPERR